MRRISLAIAGLFGVGWNFSQRSQRIPAAANFFGSCGTPAAAEGC
jgi:hypothetical protein